MTQGEVEVLPLRRVAARFLAQTEQDGLDELDTITSALFGKIRLRYVLWLIAVSVTIALLGGAILLAVAVAFAIPAKADIFAICALVFAVLFGATFLAWRFFQYGVGFVSAPRVAIYPDADATSAKNLDRFFSVVQLETAPRAFFYTRSGSRRILDRRYFFGSLRALLLAEHRWVREPAFSPEGKWFGHEVLIEADVAALIAQAQAKPKPVFKSGGRPKQIDYEAILLALIEQDRLRAIKPSERGTESQLMELIHKLCDASDDHDTNIRVPEPTELRAFSKKVLAAIAKNRLAQK